MKIGKYDIIEELGRGGMGEIYKARDPVINRTVAIKVVSSHIEDTGDLKERLYREARSAGGLSHENITVIHDVGEYEGKPYIVMEYLEGSDLKVIIDRQINLDLSVKLDYAIQICKGLKFAHNSRVIHRDIKPENIKILVNGKIKIMDFGIAKPDRSSLTEKGVLLGTPSYIAPEQIKGGEVDHRSDIFSFGVLFQELLTYKKPFNGELTSLIYKIVHDDPEPIDVEKIQFGLELQRILYRCLQKNREDRYADCGELIKDLAEIFKKVDGPPASTVILNLADLEGDLTGKTRVSTPTGTTIQNLMRRGKAFYDAGEYESARKLFLLILDRSPNNRIARDFLDRIQEELKQIEASLRTARPVEGGKKKSMLIGAAALLILAIIGAVLFWPRAEGPLPANGRDGDGPPQVAIGDRPELPIETDTDRPVADPPADQPLEETVASSWEAARDRAELTHVEADQADAKKLATAAYGEAMARRDEAAGKAATGDTAAAAGLYAEAERLFTAATTQARAAAGTLFTNLAKQAGDARRQAEQAGADRSNAVYREGLDLENRAREAMKRDNDAARTEAAVLFGSATARYKEAANRAQELSTLKSQALAARDQVVSVKRNLPDWAPLDGRADYQQAVNLEKEGARRLDAQDFDKARSAYRDAQAGFEAVATAITSEQETLAKSERQKLEKAREQADHSAARYNEGRQAEQLGDEAFGRGAFPTAAQHYRTALAAYAEAKLKSKPAADTTPPPVVDKSSGEALDAGAGRLSDRYAALMQNRDLQGLTSLLNFTSAERKGWEAFFSSAEQIQAKVAYEVTDQSAATVTVQIELDYLNKSKSSRERRDFSMVWKLKLQNDQWQIDSRE